MNSLIGSSGKQAFIPSRASVCLVLLAVRCAAQAAIEFYVSPSGNDADSGTRERPLASLDRARQAVAQRAERSQGVTVFLAGGTYYLADTLVFRAADSGAKDAPITYAALAGETPVISGGQRLQLAWSPYKDGIMQAKLPQGTTADQIFINGQRQHMARYPNYDPNAAQFNGTAADAFSASRAARWASPAGGFMHAMHSALWGDMHYFITGKDTNGNLTYVGGWQNNRRSQPHRQFRFVENIFEELDAPGEWFLNTNTSTLYFQPPVNVKLDTATIEIVRLRHLVEFRGNQKDPVRFITLRGITFRHAARTFMDNKEPLLRSDWTTYRGGAIFVNGAEDCTLQDTMIDQVGGNAVFVNDYNRGITVRDSIISDAGASGVAFVGSPDAVRDPLFEYGQTQSLEKIDRTPGPKTDDYPSDCLVEDCLIYRTGRFEKQTAPVQISMSRSVTVRHSSIYDVPRAGINICDGSWGGHTIEYCDVFDTVKETGDHGSFNSWGRDRFWRPNIGEVNAWVKQVPELPKLDAVKPIVLANNRWRCDHGWDIDLDDGSSFYIITNNLCLRGGIKNREGFGRVVENNIMVDNGYHPHVWYAESGDVFRRNIVWTDYRPANMHRPPWGAHMDFNLVQIYGATTNAPATQLKQRSGRDEHSIVADAQFADPAHGDYRVKDGSPALAMGFINFPMDQFGVQKPELKAIARVPELPRPNIPAAVATTRAAGLATWLGASVRNIADSGEMSAFGLPGVTGVLVLEVPAALAQAGLLKNDVILSVNGEKTVGTAALLKQAPALSAGSPLRIGVFRDQKDLVVQLDP